MVREGLKIPGGYEHLTLASTILLQFVNITIEWMVLQ